MKKEAKMKSSSRMILIVLLGILVAFIPVFAGSVAKAALLEKSVRIGWLSPLSGFNVEVERMFSDGARLAVDEINKAGGILGKPVELVNVDSKGTPEGILEACTDLVIRRGIKLLAGTITSREAVALRDFAKEHKVLGFLSAAQDDEHTAEKFNRYCFRAAEPVYALCKAFALYTTSKPWTKIYVVSRDDTHGRELFDKFWMNIRKLKPEVKSVGESWPSVTTMDFTSIVAAVAASGADACILAHYGPRFVSFVRQAQAFGLFQKMVLMNFNGLATDCTAPLGKNFPPQGIVATTSCPWWLQEPAMQKYTRGCKEFTGGVLPGFLSFSSYKTIYFIAKGVEKAKTTDVEKVIGALEGLTIDSPVGPITVRDFDHQVVNSIWMAEGTVVPEHPLAIGINMVKYGEELYPTKEQLEAVRRTGKWQ